MPPIKPPGTWVCTVDGTVMSWTSNRGSSGWRCPDCNGRDAVEVTSDAPDEP